MAPRTRHRRAAEIAACAVAMIAIDSALRWTLSGPRFWSLGSWVGTIYYAAWAALLWGASSTLRRTLWVPAAPVRTRASLALIAVVIVATDCVYGWKLVQLVAGLRSPHAPASWVHALNAVVCAPIVEEALFRGVLWDAVAARSSPPVALAVTSVVFAPWHWATWFEPAWSGAAGTPLLAHASFAVLMGVLRWRLGAIGPSVVAHGTWNGLAVVLAR